MALPCFRAGRKEDMCSGHRKLSPPPLPPSGTVAPASGEAMQPSSETAALLLEIAASDDLAAFKRAVEDEGHPFDVAAGWYGRSPSRGMGYQQRTPLMIAALYGSTGVMGYLLSARPAEAARRAASDGATALHCAAAGGSPASLEAVKLLIGADADVVDALDASGNRPGDVVARQSLTTVAKSLGVILKAPPFPGLSSPGKEEQPKQGEKKEYPPDSTLPDINTGIYGTDEFRMYTFKIKPCSRAYSHDWTECPFVHPGENARRRDPRKFSYSCVPCLEFRKGSCRNGDACEYAHGVFESWLHPAQYRTRLCKDETGCNRRVCFFAHKPEELRSVNPSAASVAGTLLSSPRSSSPALSSLDMTMALTLMQQPGSPMSPTASSGLGAAAAWMNQAGGLMTPPALQLPSSRLKASVSARELDFDLELLGLEGYQQKLVDGITRTASPRANRGANTLAAAAARAPEYTNLLGSVDPSLLTQLQGLSMRKTGGTQFQSPAGIQMHQPQLQSGYGGSQCSSPPVSSTPSFGLDRSTAKAIMNARASAFAMRSQSFRQSMLSTMTTAATPSLLSDWGSPDGKLDWGIQGEELSKLRKSTSFALRGNHAAVGRVVASGPNEPDVSWVKDGPGAGEHRNADMFSPWPEEKIMA
ncbi:zinc finger CCCH domain-containing protein [Musa troglodytarum]|uniref:Zinc finger CCCH domain-containing protein n=1 Tax=Musa troglodytarum TaxID=320322 RepID=A0A9E7EQT7_9LILI|nr:zinc finger CCCH domain-containing protein [Musa troglodytarum]